ncbi:MAG: hypothetical protein KME45_01235 [Stenomitos rutilans HA7619-LM2]|jgi:putative transposase|nr:hypothetical protein [Stenomitos rutilans HA7619-LM2]
MTLAYDSELTLEPFELFQALQSAEPKTGRPRIVDLMQVLQAIVYVRRFTTI